MTVRTYLTGYLQPAVEALGWLYYDHDRTLSAIGKVTALLVHTRVEPAPEQGSLLHTVSLVVVDPTQQETAAENNLDDHMEDLIPILQGIPAVQFVQAEKGTRDSSPAWDIQITVKTTA